MTFLRRSHPPPPPEEPVVWSAEAGDGAAGVSLAWVSRPRVGESESGDGVVVRRLGSAILVAVIDALGHGPRAAEVGRASMEWLASAEASDATSVVQGLHRELRGSRGAAALVFLVSAGELEVCSVGNVELRSQTGRLPFVLTPGVLGVRLRQPRSCRIAPPLSDRFVLFSDGISSRFDLKSLRSQSPRELAAHLFAFHRHTHDDSTVVVVDVADATGRGAP